MSKFEILSSRKWRNDISKRTNYRSFSIPSIIVSNCKFKDHTKRSILITTDKGDKLCAIATISSGNEFLVPKSYQNYFECVKWIECKVLDNVEYLEREWKPLN